MLLIIRTSYLSLIHTLLRIVYGHSLPTLQLLMIYLSINMSWRPTLARHSRKNASLLQKSSLYLGVSSVSECYVSAAKESSHPHVYKTPPVIGTFQIFAGVAGGT
jgi:hypothetical protein